MSWRTLETVAWFALYAALVGFALLWDSAAPFYRQIFIERTVSDWVPGATRDYIPGTVIRGDEASAVYAGGWWTPWKDFRWGKGRTGRLLMRPTMDLPAGSRLVALVSALPVRFGPARELVTTIGGQVVDQRTVGPELQTIDAALPTVVAAGEDLEITFTIDRVQTPQSLGVSDDAMGVGVALHDFAVLPPA